MKRSLFLGLLGSTAAHAAVRTPDDAVEDRVICEFAGDVLNRYAEGDFTGVALRTHPRALKFFRDLVVTGFENLADHYGEAKVLEASELEQHPKSLAIKDDAFMVRCLMSASKKHPEFNVPKPGSNLKIIGGIVELEAKESFAHVIYDFRGELNSKESKVAYVSPNLLTLIRGKEDWQIWSPLGGKTVPSCWAYELDEDTPDKSLNR